MRDDKDTEKRVYRPLGCPAEELEALAHVLAIEWRAEQAYRTKRRIEIAKEVLGPLGFWDESHQSHTKLYDRALALAGYVRGSDNMETHERRTQA